MTNKKQRSLEREINNLLYRNLTREGITMDHIDPSRLKDWPLHSYPENEGDYVNLLPPSYREPFAPSPKKTKRRKREKKQSQGLRESMSSEWSLISKNRIESPFPSSENRFGSALFFSLSCLVAVYTIVLFIKMLPSILSGELFHL